MIPHPITRNPTLGGMNHVTNLLVSILNAIYGFVGNHGWAVVLFTLLIRLLLLPLEIKSRKGMRKMQQIQPQLNKLQQKYANDRVKLQQKQSELMRREKYNPLSGCLPMLIQLPILFAMFAAMRQIANEQTVKQAFAFLQGETPMYEGWLWVKNLWMADSPFMPSAPNLHALQMIPANVWQTVWAGLGEAGQSSILAQLQGLEGFAGLDFSTAAGLKAALPFIDAGLLTMPAYMEAVRLVPGWANMNFILFTVSLFKQYNGLLILPVLAGLSQVMMTKVTPGMSQPQQAGDQQAGMNNFMKYFFPIFSVYICLTSNAGFALYWVVANLIATATNIGITKYFDKQDALKGSAVTAEDID